MNVKLLCLLYGVPWPILIVWISHERIYKSALYKGTMRAARTGSRLQFDNVKHHVKQVSSPPRYQRYIEPPSPNNRTLMLSRFDCYLGFVFMTKVLIYYDRIRGIMIAKKFMESLNYVNGDGNNSLPKDSMVYRIDSFGRECSDLN